MSLSLVRHINLFLFSLFLFCCSFSASASDFLGGSVTWQDVELDADGQRNDATIRVVTAWVSFNDPISLNISPGVGTVTQISESIINIGGLYDLKTTEFQVKDLDLNAQYLVSYAGNPRISNLLNNANGSWDIQAVIFLKDDNLATKIDLPILYDIPQLEGDGTTILSDFVFNVNTADPNADQIRFRLANTAEMGGGSNPAGFTINANTGIVTWIGSGTVTPGLYSVGVIAEDIDSTGAVKSKSGADFILDIQNKAGVQFTTTGGIPSSNTIVVNKGVTFNFGVTSATSTITSASLGDLSGTLTEPTESNYEFTPGVSGLGLEPGTYPVTIEMVDSSDLTTNSYLALTFIVVDPSAPQLANIEGDSVTYSATAALLIDAGVDAVLTDADSTDLNGGSLKLQVIFADSEYEELGITSVGDNPGEIRVTGSEIFFAGNKIGDINSIENGVGTALQIQFTTPNATLAAVQALVRSLNYTDTFLLREVGIRGLTLFIADSDANSNSYRLDVDVQGHPTAPTSGGPLEGSNRITIQNGGSLILTSSQLRYVDPDTADASIALTVSELANGRFELISSPGTPILDFTQEQVNNGQIQFVHTVPNSLPAYSISASDGVNSTVASAATVFFSITSTGAADAAKNQTTAATVTSAVVTSPTSFSIVSGDDRTLFSINPSTGVLSFISAPDAEIPKDADTNNVYVVDVRITDGQVNDIKTMSITVTDVNDNVVIITSNGGGETAAIDVDENTSSVTTVVAQDDITSTIVYSKTGGTDQGAFTLNSSTGELTFTSPPDFEDPADSDINNTYVVEVTADVSGVSDTQTITVTVLAVNEAPVFTSGATFTPDEGGTAIGTVVAQDPESSGLSYSLTGGVDQGDFSITAGGVLSFSAVTDFEAPVDSDTNNSYTVQVTATDGVNPVAQTITVNVQDVNETPIFTSGATFTPDEGGTAIGTVVAQDPESAGLSYSLTGGVDQGDFSITAGGVLSFVAIADFEAPVDSDTNNSYTVQVTVTDGVNPVAQTITVNVQAVNEGPVFTSGATFTLIEGGTAIGTITAQDPESAGLSYSLTGGVDQGAFSITTGGVLSFISATDFDNPVDSDMNNSYTVQVTVTDGLNQVVQSITVNVRGSSISDGDGDGIPDVFDSPDTDTDGDGIPDSLDVDSDGDGVPDSEETGASGIDTDGDGIDDAFDVDQTGGTDANGDGFDDNPQFADTDADGIPDFVDKDGGNGSGIGLGGDSDGDGIPDQVECPVYPNCADTDGDGIPDYSDADTAVVSSDLEKIDTGLKGIGSFNPLILLTVLLLRLLRNAKYVAVLVSMFFFTSMSVAVSADEGAKEISWYAGAGVGQSKLDPDTDGTIFTVEDDADNGFKLFAGYEITEGWFVELGYSDLGKAEMETFGEVGYRFIGLSGRYNFLDYELFGEDLILYAKAGVASLDNQSNIPVNNKNSTQLVYGAGIEYPLLESLVLRAELETYDKDASFVSLNIVKYFGQKAKNVKKIDKENDWY